MSDHSSQFWAECRFCPVWVCLLFFLFFSFFFLPVQCHFFFFLGQNKALVTLTLTLRSSQISLISIHEWSYEQRRSKKKNKKGSARLSCGGLTCERKNGKKLKKKKKKKRRKRGEHTRETHCIAKEEELRELIKSRWGCGCTWVHMDMRIEEKWLGVTFKFREASFFRNTQNVSVIYKRTN